jgi:hypothetical protein
MRKFLLFQLVPIVNPHALPDACGTAANPTVYRPLQDGMALPDQV